jgi:hypothetical protein
MPERPFRLSAHLTDETRRAGKRLLQFSAIFRHQVNDRDRSKA